MSVTVFGCAQGLLAVAVVHISPKKVNQIKSYDPATSFTDEGWARRGFQERPSKVGTAKKTHEAREGSGFRKNRIKSFASESFSILSSFTLYQAVSSKTAIWRCPWTTIWDVQKPAVIYPIHWKSMCKLPAKRYLQQNDAGHHVLESRICISLRAVPLADSRLPTARLNHGCPADPARQWTCGSSGWRVEADAPLSSASWVRTHRKAAMAGRWLTQARVEAEAILRKEGMA